MKTFRTLFKIEFKLSLRDMNMLIFAIGMPLVIAIIIGIIYGNKVAIEGASFTFYQQSFSALAAISIASAGIMGLPLVLADYRRKKILKRYKVTPISPMMLLMVQFAINLLYCIMSIFVLYLVSILFFDYKFLGSLFLFLILYFLVLISIFSIGVFIAAIAKSEKSANLLTTIFYFPMLIFSGATLPYEIMPQVMKNIADIMPLTQGIKLLKDSSLGISLENNLFPLIIIIMLPIILIPISIKQFKWE